MRDRVEVEFGGRVYSLLPTFEVTDAFEGRFNGLFDHLEKLSNGIASIHVRGFLMYLGLKASDDSTNWTEEAVRKSMFEAGHWSEDMVAKEIEFIQRLIYTPEQFQAKKEAEEAARAEMMELLDASSDGPSNSPQ